MNTKNKTLIVLLVLAILFVVFYILPRSSKDAQEKDLTGDVNSATTTEEETEVIITIDEEGNPTVEGGVLDIIEIEDETPPAPSAPSLNRAVSIPEIFPEDAAKLMATKIADAIAAIEIDPSYTNWLLLGNLRNQIQDYEGAKEVYEYLTLFESDSPIAYTNLGNIYHYHIPNYETAEANYLVAIEKDPENKNAYTELHTLYKNVYKTDSTAAVDILLRGLENDPESIDLMLLLAKYYEDKGDVVEQLVYLEKALDEANRSNNTALADSLNSEISGLK